AADAQRRVARDVMAIEIDSGRPTATPHTRSGRGRIGAQALGQATRQLAVMLGAGLPVVSSLRLLAEQADRPRLRHTLHDVARLVEAGSTLAEATAAHADVFPPLYRTLVSAGEAGGVLEAVLHPPPAPLGQAAQPRGPTV